LPQCHLSGVIGTIAVHIIYIVATLRSHTIGCITRRLVIIHPVKDGFLRISHMPLGNSSCSATSKEGGGGDIHCIPRQRAFCARDGGCSRDQFAGVPSSPSLSSDARNLSASLVCFGEVGILGWIPVLLPTYDFGLVECHLGNSNPMWDSNRILHVRRESSHAPQMIRDVMNFLPVGRLNR